jgi:ferritin-like metal-binding protein YciE
MDSAQMLLNAKKGFARGNVLLAVGSLVACRGLEPPSWWQANVRPLLERHKQDILNTAREREHVATAMNLRWMLKRCDLVWPELQDLYESLKSKFMQEITGFMRRRNYSLAMGIVQQLQMTDSTGQPVVAWPELETIARGIKKQMGKIDESTDLQAAKREVKSLEATLAAAERETEHYDIPNGFYSSLMIAKSMGKHAALARPAFDAHREWMLSRLAIMIKNRHNRWYMENILMCLDVLGKVGVDWPALKTIGQYINKNQLIVSEDDEDGDDVDDADMRYLVSDIVDDLINDSYGGYQIHKPELIDRKLRHLDEQGLKHLKDAMDDKKAAIIHGLVYSYFKASPYYVREMNKVMAKTPATWPELSDLPDSLWPNISKALIIHVRDGDIQNPDDMIGIVNTLSEHGVNRDDIIDSMEYLINSWIDDIETHLKEDGYNDYMKDFLVSLEELGVARERVTDHIEAVRSEVLQHIVSYIRAGRWYHAAVAVDDLTHRFDREWPQLTKLQATIDQHRKRTIAEGQDTDHIRKVAIARASGNMIESAIKYLRGKLETGTPRADIDSIALEIKSPVLSYLTNMLRYGKNVIHCQEVLDQLHNLGVRWPEMARLQSAVDLIVKQHSDKISRDIYGD